MKLEVLEQLPDSGVSELDGSWSPRHSEHRLFIEEISGGEDMPEPVKQLGLMVLFGFAGALATLAAWYSSSGLLSILVPRQLLELSLFAVGLLGPLVVWVAVLVVTQGRSSASLEMLRPTAAAGLAVVAATQLAFYIPLGFMCLAFGLTSS